MKEQSAPPTHEIRINLQDGHEAIPEMPLPNMAVHETVRFFSPDGKVKIVFPDASPFREDDEQNTEVRDGEIITLVRDNTDGPTNKFTFRCFITPPNGQEVGWSENSRASGADPHIRKPKAPGEQ